ncbi:MAG TPA: tetratricopeptide repeat protein [Candidatus Krumholzibacteria bacterium]|nr:tetratricopeptide repeat protein [Candidatus Krumholzibacteria bacterium]
MDRRELSNDQWRRISGTLDAVLSAGDAAEREQIIARACGDDRELRTRIERMLASAEGGAFDRPAPELAADLIEDALHDHVPARLGQRVGPYRIRRTLGMGGMGVVYLAERDDAQFQQSVALKLVRAVHTDPVSLQRFVIERQILADLDHPNLARLLDGGVTGDGSPYIVMEYVDGVPITDYCDTRGHGIEERLRLFLAVCDVVDFAHSNLIVHRDLKPSNILVTPDGTIKLLDFGVAKLLDPDRVGELTLTRPDSSPLTPEYASPEQMLGRPVTTASDVYSLGVLLYTLLAGRKPYVLEPGMSAAQWEGTVCEEMPSAPSAVATDAVRARRLRGDLDSIVLMALRKEPERRYPSARELARDIDRHRHREPVVARPDEVGYRLGRFVRRNRTAVLAVGAVVVALLGGLGLALWQARVAAGERDRARAESARRDALSEALIDIISLADPGESPVDVAAGKQVLDYALGRVEVQFAGQPDVQTRVLRGIADGYAGMGDYAGATGILDRALARCHEAFGPASLEEAAVLQSLASARFNLGEIASADSLNAMSLNIRLQFLAPDDTLLIGNYFLQGVVANAMRRFEESERYYRKTLDIEMVRHGPDHEATASCYANVAVALNGQGRLVEAEANHRRAIGIWEARGLRHPDLAETYNNLAMLVGSQGRAREMAELNGKALDIYRELDLGGIRYANILNTQGNVLVDAGQYAEAETVLRESLALNVASAGESSMQSAANHLTLSRALVGLRRYTEAGMHARQGFETFRAALGDDHQFVAAAMAYVGDAEWRAGNVEKGQRLLESALAAQRAQLPASAWRASQTLYWLGQLNVSRDQPDAADSMLREAIAFRLDRHPETSWAIAEVQIALGESLVRRGRYDEAREVLDTAVANLTEVSGKNDPRAQAGVELLASLPAPR